MARFILMSMCTRSHLWLWRRKGNAGVATNSLTMRQSTEHSVHTDSSCLCPQSWTEQRSKYIRANQKAGYKNRRLPSCFFPHYFCTGGRAEQRVNVITSPSPETASHNLCGSTHSVQLYVCATVIVLLDCLKVLPPFSIMIKLEHFMETNFCNAIMAKIFEFSLHFKWLLRELYC